MTASMTVDVIDCPPPNKILDCATAFAQHMEKV